MINSKRGENKIVAKKLTRRTNRLISIICVCIFTFSLVCLGSVLYSIYQTYQENERLKEEYQRIQEEMEYMEKLFDKVDKDGYYNVYADGELVIYDGEDKPIIVIINK